MKQNNIKEIINIALRLLIICSIVAVIVAFVHTITKDKIKHNEMLSSADALSQIFSSDFDNIPFTVIGEEFVVKDGDTTIATCTAVDYSKVPVSDDITALYALNANDGTSLGYCVAIEPMGFKDKVKMLVAVTPDVTVKGVKIVSMSETKGYGSKAGEDWFLNQFMGLNEGAAAEVDIISGATKTSKPVISAVSVALKQVSEYKKISGGSINGK